MKHKKIAVIFLGDYRYDGRCFNMVNSMIAGKYLVDIYHVSKNLNQPGHIQSNRLKVLTINPVSTKILKYVHWTFLVYNKIKTVINCYTFFMSYINRPKPHTLCS